MAEEASSSRVNKTVLPSQVVRDGPLVSRNFVTAAPAHTHTDSVPNKEAAVNQAAVLAPSAAGTAVKQAAVLAPSAAGTTAGNFVTAATQLTPTEAQTDSVPYKAAAGVPAVVLAPSAAGRAVGLQSYADIARGNYPDHQSPHKAAILCSSRQAKFTDPTPFQSRPTNGANGPSSIIVTRTEKNRLVNNLKWVLIGKFSHGRPSLRAIQQFFKNIELEGDINCANLDAKHIIIECSCYNDFYFIWLQLIWNIHGYDMRMFKWLPNFSAKVESSIAPTWIRIEGLALYLFDESTLLRIASIIGNPIKVDTRNVERSNLGSARVCVELDVDKPIINSISIDIVDEQTGETIETLFASVFYDVLPKFCKRCSHIGHQEEYCKRKLASFSHIHTSQESDKHSNLVMVVPSQNQRKKVWTVVPPKSVASLDKGTGTVAGCTSSVQSAKDGTRTLQGQAHNSKQPSSPQVRTSSSAQVEAKTASQPAPQQVVSVADCGSAGESHQTTLGTHQILTPAQALGLSYTREAADSVAQPTSMNEADYQLEGPLFQPAAAITAGPELLPTAVIDQQEVQVAAVHPDAIGASGLRPQVLAVSTGNVFELLQIGEQEGTDHTSPSSLSVASSEDIPRPKSADSTLGRKQTLMQMLELGPRKSIEQNSYKQTTHPSWADEVEAMEDLEEVGCKLQHQAPVSENDWQVVTHKKKRTLQDDTTPRGQILASSTSGSPKQQGHKARGDISLDPDYNIEQLHARIQKMKRDSPQKRQLQAELKVLRGA